MFETTQLEENFKINYKTSWMGEAMNVPHVGDEVLEAEGAVLRVKGARQAPSHSNTVAWTMAQNRGEGDTQGR